jgi:hypothetical protein
MAVDEEGASMVAADGSPATFLVGMAVGREGTPTDAEEEEALAGKGRVKTCRHKGYDRANIGRA